MPTNGFSIKPLKVKLLAGEQQATELWNLPFWIDGPWGQLSKMAGSAAGQLRLGKRLVQHTGM